MTANMKVNTTYRSANSAAAEDFRAGGISISFSLLPAVVSIEYMKAIARQHVTQGSCTILIDGVGYEFDG